MMTKIIILVFLTTLNTFGQNWKFVKTYEGVKLFSLEQKENGLIPFKAIYQSDIHYKEFVKLLFDHSNKKNWAPKLKNLKLHSTKEKSFVFSEYYQTPWPFYDREFLLVGQVYRENGKVFFEAHNAKNKELAHRDHVLADVKELLVELEPINGKTKITFTFKGFMGGFIPKFVSNIIQKKWPVRFIQAMVKEIKENGTIESKEFLLQRKELKL